MSDSSGPREVFQRLLGAIADRDWDRITELYAPDAVVDLPFAPPAPLRLAGRSALREHFEAARKRPLEIRVDDVSIRGTDDPEVIVAEFDYFGTVTETGRTFHVSNIAVVRVRDGRIVESRDHHDHLAIGKAFGVADQTVAEPA